MPTSATRPAESQSTYDERTQKPMSPMKTPATTASVPLTGPSLSSSFCANSGAAGVLRTSGGSTRMISGGISTLETTPGTRPARNQLAQVISMPATWRARSPISRLAALL